MKKVICSILLAICLVGCGEKEPEFVNLSEGCVYTLASGDCSVLETNDLSAFDEELVKSVLGTINVDSSSTNGANAVYSISVADTEACFEDLIHSSVFEQKINECEITGDWSNFDSWFWALYKSKLSEADRVQIDLIGYFDKALLVNSGDLKELVGSVNSREVPHTFTKEVVSVVDLPIKSGDFVYEVEGNRILVSNIMVLEGDNARKRLEQIDSTNKIDTEKNPVLLVYNVTNLSKETLVVKASFVGLTEDGYVTDSSFTPVGLTDVANLEQGNSAQLSSFVTLDEDDVLVWYAPEKGATIYDWRLQNGQYTR